MSAQGTAPDSERVQRVITRAAAGTVRARSDGTTHGIFPFAIPPAEGVALSRWVLREAATSTIEIGLGYGMSALSIFRGLLDVGSPTFAHLAIDPNQKGFSDIGLQLLDEAGVREHLEFHAEPSEIVLPRLLGDARRFDFAFVDGNHRFDWVFCDLVLLGRLVKGGAVIFLDDYQLPSVRKAVAFCTRNLGWSIDEEGAADDKHHWVVLRTTVEPLHRDFDDFLDF